MFVVTRTPLGTAGATNRYMKFLPIMTLSASVGLNRIEYINMDANPIVSSSSGGIVAHGFQLKEHFLFDV